MKKSNLVLRLCAFVAVLAVSCQLSTIQAQESMYTYKAGVLVSKQAVLQIDSVTFNTLTQDTIYTHYDGIVMKRRAIAQIDSITFSAPDIPRAGLMDIVFKADGTAEDVSPLNYNVNTLEGMAMTTIYSNRFDQYIAQFNHSPGTTTANGFYQRDYTNDQAFKNALSSGHSLETMFMLDVASPFPNLEMKMISSHQSGGTGLMIGDNSKGNSILFLPHVGGSYCWAISNVTPEQGKYYHVVGVWNKEEGKAHVYVNGELKGSVDAIGAFKFPSTGSTWFGIGADPTKASGQSPWKGEVVVARVYDKALNAGDVEKLWNNVRGFEPNADDIALSEVKLISKMVQLNGTYTIQGQGFQVGDKIKIKPVTGGGSEYLLDGITDDYSLTLTIPESFTAGKYRFFVVRAEKVLDIGFATFTVGEKPIGQAQVIAHRGYWKGSNTSQNSIASLTKAQELDIYGAEFDVWITTDGVVVLNHDATIGGIKIETSTYNDLKDVRLSNGEKIPTLKDYIDQAKKDPSTKLILEIKTHSSTVNNDRVAAACVQMMKDENMTAQVEYIANSIDVCKKVVELEPTAIVAYLKGDFAPYSLKNMGIVGLDYNISVIRNNTAWIAQAHSLGMKVNVWTVNSAGDIQEMIDVGVDYITTDEPILVKQMIDNN